MATLTLEWGYATGQTLTAELFDRGGNIPLYTADTVEEESSATGRYVGTWFGIPVGDYMLVYYLAGVGVGSEFYSLADQDARFYPWSETKPASGTGGAGEFVYTVSMRFMDSQANAISGAYASVVGQTSTGVSDLAGLAYTGVNTGGSYELSVIAPSGYSYTGTIAFDVTAADVDLGDIILQETGASPIEYPPVQPPSGGWTGE